MDAPNQKPIAKWDSARDVLTTVPVFDMLPIFELSDVFSETLPTSGSMRSGEVFSRPMLVPRMDGTEYSFLPTPAAYDATRGGTQHPDKRRAGGHQPSLADVAEHL